MLIVRVKSHVFTYIGDKLNHWSKVVVLDLCAALAETAKKRVRARGWTSFVDVVVGDACDTECPGLPASGTVDVVTFSYALTMVIGSKILSLHIRFF